MKTSTERRTLRRKIASTAAAFFAVGALVFGVAAPASATVYPGTYLRPISALGTALDIWDANNYVGAWVGTYKQHPGWNQRFNFLNINGAWQFRAQNGMCLRVGGYQPSIRNTPIVTAYCNIDDPAQMWTAIQVVIPNQGPQRGLLMKNKATGNCLDATADKWVVDYPCHNGDNQHWETTTIDW